jgi:hypothetical protein
LHLSRYTTITGFTAHSQSHRTVALNVEDQVELRACALAPPFAQYALLLLLLTRGSASKSKFIAFCPDLLSQWKTWKTAGRCVLALGKVIRVFDCWFFPF